MIARSVFTLFVSWLGFAAAAYSASYYWDTNGTTTGSGSAGGTTAAWLSNSWSTSSTGTGSVGAWPNATPSPHEAVFQGTAGTVQITADVFANALRFQTNNYVISSTGGSVNLTGTNPTVTVNLTSNNQVVTLTAPLVAASGLTLAGNSLSGGLKFLVLANTSATTPNQMGSLFTIAAGGALRLGGGATREQISDLTDLQVDGVLDFITSGGASDGKQEQVRKVTVAGTGANFSIGNGSNFVVNSITGNGTDTGSGIALNGNNASVPGKLSITGWSDGQGHLTLNTSRVKLNTTGATSAIGGRVLLSGNLVSTGSSVVINNNGAAATANTNTFTNKAFDFTSAAHSIQVTDGVLTFTSAGPSHPLEVTSTAPGGTTLTKTGGGVWLWEHAVQTAFTGAVRVEQGAVRLGANERLANNIALEVAGGAFELNSFQETITNLTLQSGSIVGTGALNVLGAMAVESGTITGQLLSASSLLKRTAGTVTISSAQAYTGDTLVEGGVLSLGAASLSNLADVKLSPGATLNLNFTGADQIDSLFINGVSQAVGTWGRLGSGAMHESALLTGDGLLQVTTFIPSILPGDYNNDHQVNAADYTLYRDNIGTATALQNDAIGGTIGAAHYAQWANNFGATSAAAAATTVPEPAGLVLLGLGALAAGAGRRFLV